MEVLRLPKLKRECHMFNIQTLLGFQYQVALKLPLNIVRHKDTYLNDPC